MKRAATVVFALAAPAAVAQEAWSFRLTPYLWAPALDTEAAVGRGQTASASTSVLDVLEGAALVTGEARRGGFALLGEVNYLNLGERATGPGGRVSADLDLDGVMAALTAAVTVHDADGLRIEALGGARVWSLEAKVDFDALPAASVRRTWVDPLIGARARYAVGPRLSVEALGAIGGFGVGSDLQWEAVGRAAWRIDERFTVAAGWRHLSLDFDDDRLVLEMTMSGPFVALDIEF